MMAKKVTSLKVQKRNPQRVNVYLDGEFAFGLSRITAAWLEIGKELDDSAILELQSQDEGEVAYQKAISFLGYRPRSENEVAQNLRKHGFPEGVIENILDRLGRQGLVDDSSFAQSWVENRSEFRPRGRTALRMELRQKGIAKEVIDTVLENVDEKKLARQAALKQSRKYHQLDWADYRKKMIAFLARRGFSYRTAAEVAEEVWSGSGSDQTAEVG
jgi:regulatory protein